MNQNKFLADLKRRNPDLPLSLGELIALKEISYMELRRSPVAMELLVRYSEDSKFQLRLLEHSYILTNIIPLLSTDNEIEQILFGSQIFANLTKNPEIHGKCKDTDILRILQNHIMKQPHFEIMKSAVRSLAHLAREPKVCEQIWKMGIFSYLENYSLDSSDFHTQKYILKLSYWLTLDTPKNLICKKVHRFFLKEQSLRPLLRSLLSNDKKVVLHSVKVIRNLLQNFENISRLEEFKIMHRLIQTYKSESAVQDPNSTEKLKQKIILAIITTIRGVIVIPEYHYPVAKKKFLKFFIEMLGHQNLEISCNSAICLAHISENLQMHDALFTHGVIDKIAKILVLTKYRKIYAEAARFLSNISWNSKYLKMLISLNFIGNLLTSLHRAKHQYTIITLANMSSIPYFHVVITRTHIKLIVLLLELREVANDPFYLGMASLTLVNLSSNFNFHASFLAEPQISILYKHFLGGSKAVLKNLAEVVTNLSFNASCIPKLVQHNFFSLVLKYLEDSSKQDFTTTLVKSLVGFCVSKDCQKIMSEKKILSIVVALLHISETKSQKELFLALISILEASSDFHEEFMSNSGLVLVEIFLQKSDILSKYYGIKLLSFLTRFEVNIKEILKKKMDRLIGQACETKDIRILKEAIRIYMNILQCNPMNQEVARTLIDYITVGLTREDNQECISLSLFSLQFLSELPANHDHILSSPTLLQTLTSMNYDSLSNKPESYVLTFLNLVANPSSHSKIVAHNVISTFIKLLDKANENCKGYMEMIVYLLIKYGYFLQVCEHGGEELLIRLLKSTQQTFRVEILDTIKLLLREKHKHSLCTKDYDPISPTILAAIEDIAFPKEAVEEMSQKEVFIRLNILFYVSETEKSLQDLYDHNLLMYIDKILSSTPNNDNVVMIVVSLLANLSCHHDFINGIIKLESLPSLVSQIKFNTMYAKKEFLKLAANLSLSPHFDPHLISNEFIMIVIGSLRQTGKTGILDHRVEIFTIGSLVLVHNLVLHNIRSVPILLGQGVPSVLSDLINSSMNKQKIVGLSFFIFAKMAIYTSDSPDFLKTIEGFVELAITVLEINREGLAGKTFLAHSLLEFFMNACNNQSAINSIPNEQLMKGMDELIRLVMSTGSESYHVLAFQTFNILLRDREALLDHFLKKKVGPEYTLSLLARESNIKTRQSKRYRMKPAVHAMRLIRGESKESPSKKTDPSFSETASISKTEKQGESPSLRNSPSLPLKPLNNEDFRKERLVLIEELVRLILKISDKPENFRHLASIYELQFLIDSLYVVYTTPGASKQLKELIMGLVMNILFQKEVLDTFKVVGVAFTNAVLDDFVHLYDEEAVQITSIRFLTNVCMIDKYSEVVCKDFLLKKINSLFLSSSTSRPLRELIQILLMNFTFNVNLHAILLQHDALKIFEYIPRDGSADKELSQHSFKSIINLSLNPFNFRLIENEINMVNSLGLIDEVNKYAQIRMLKSVLTYLFSKDEAASGPMNIHFGSGGSLANSGEGFGEQSQYANEGLLNLRSSTNNFYTGMNVSDNFLNIASSESNKFKNFFAGLSGSNPLSKSSGSFVGDPIRSRPESKEVSPKQGGLDEEKEKLRSTSRTNKIDILTEVMASLVQMVESKSTYLINNLAPLLLQVSQHELISEIPYDSRRIFENVIVLAIKFHKRKVRHCYICALLNLSALANFYEKNHTLKEPLNLLFEFTRKLMKKFVPTDSHSVLEYYLVFFLRFVSNAAVAGRPNKSVGVFLLQKEVEDFLLSILVYCRKKGEPLILEILAVYANLLQSENVCKFYNITIISYKLLRISKKAGRVGCGYLLGCLQGLLHCFNYSLRTLYKTTQRQLVHGNKEQSNLNGKMETNREKKKKEEKAENQVWTAHLNRNNKCVIGNKSDGTDRQVLLSADSLGANDKLYGHSLTIRNFPGTGGGGIVDNDFVIFSKSSSMHTGAESESTNPKKEGNANNLIIENTTVQFALKMISLSLKKYDQWGGSSEESKRDESSQEENFQGTLTSKNQGGLSSSPKSGEALGFRSKGEASDKNNEDDFEDEDFENNSLLSLKETGPSQAFLTIMANLTSVQKNIPLLLETKVPDRLLAFLSAPQHLKLSKIADAVIACTNLATCPQFLSPQRLNRILDIVQMLFKENPSCFVENGLDLLVNIIVHIKEEDLLYPLADDIIMLMGEIDLVEGGLEVEAIEKWIRLLHAILHIDFFKYRLVKVEKLFKNFFRFLQDVDYCSIYLINLIYSVWLALPLLTESLECLIYLHKYRLDKLLHRVLHLFCDNEFLNMEKMQEKLLSNPFLTLNSIQKAEISLFDLNLEEESNNIKSKIPLAIVVFHRVSFLSLILTILTSTLENERSKNGSYSPYLLYFFRSSEASSHDGTYVTFEKNKISRKTGSLDHFPELGTQNSNSEPEHGLSSSEAGVSVMTTGIYQAQPLQMLPLSSSMNHFKLAPEAFINALKETVELLLPKLTWNPAEKKVFLRHISSFIFNLFQTAILSEEDSSLANSLAEILLQVEKILSKNHEMISQSESKEVNFVDFLINGMYLVSSSIKHEAITKAIAKNVHIIIKGVSATKEITSILLKEKTYSLLLRLLTEIPFPVFEFEFLDLQRILNMMLFYNTSYTDISLEYLSLILVKSLFVSCHSLDDDIMRTEEVIDYLTSCNDHLNRMATKFKDMSTAIKNVLEPHEEESMASRGKHQMLMRSFSNSKVIGRVHHFGTVGTSPQINSGNEPDMQTWGIEKRNLKLIFELALISFKFPEAFDRLRNSRLFVSMHGLVKNMLATYHSVYGARVQDTPGSNRQLEQVMTIPGVKDILPSKHEFLFFFKLYLEVLYLMNLSSSEVNNSGSEEQIEPKERMDSFGTAHLAKKGGGGFKGIGGIALQMDVSVKSKSGLHQSHNSRENGILDDLEASDLFSTILYFLCGPEMISFRFFSYKIASDILHVDSNLEVTDSFFRQINVFFSQKLTELARNQAQGRLGFISASFCPDLLLKLLIEVSMRFEFMHAAKKPEEKNPNEAYSHKDRLFLPTYIGHLLVNFLTLVVEVDVSLLMKNEMRKLLPQTLEIILKETKRSEDLLLKYTFVILRIMVELGRDEHIFRRNEEKNTLTDSVRFFEYFIEILVSKSFFENTFSQILSTSIPAVSSAFPGLSFLSSVAASDILHSLAFRSYSILPEKGARELESLFFWNFSQKPLTVGSLHWLLKLINLEIVSVLIGIFKSYYKKKNKTGLLNSSIRKKETLPLKILNDGVLKMFSGIMELVCKTLEAMDEKKLEEDAIERFIVRKMVGFFEQSEEIIKTYPLLSQVLETGYFLSFLARSMDSKREKDTQESLLGSMSRILEISRLKSFLVS